MADREATRAGIRIALDDDVDVCGEAGGAEEAIRIAKREQPDLCLVGATLHGDGIRLVRGICRAAPNAAVVVLDQEPDVETMLESVRAGAIGYVPGNLDRERLHGVIQAVAAKEAVVPRVMVLELLLEIRGAGGGNDGLTRREMQILGMVRRGHSTSEIANRLEIAPVTVRRHISEVVHKLGLDSRSALLSS